MSAHDRMDSGDHAVDLLLRHSGENRHRIADAPETPMHTAALALLRRSLKTDEQVKRDRAIVKSVNRVEIALRK